MPERPANATVSSFHRCSRRSIKSHLEPAGACTTMCVTKLCRLPKFGSRPARLRKIGCTSPAPNIAQTYPKSDVFATSIGIKFARESHRPIKLALAVGSIRIRSSSCCFKPIQLSPHSPTRSKSMKSKSIGKRYLTFQRYSLPSQAILYLDHHQKRKPARNHFGPEPCRDSSPAKTSCSKTNSMRLALAGVIP